MLTGLAECSEFDSLWVELLASLVNPPADRIESRLHAILQRCADSLGMDGASLALDRGADRIRLAVSCAVPELPLPDFEELARQFPMLASRLDRGEFVLLPQPAEGGESDAVAARDLCAQTGLQACALIPLRSTGGTAGTLRLFSRRRSQPWPAEQVGRLRILGTGLAEAWDRDLAAVARRQTAQDHLALLASSPDGIWRIATDNPIPTAAPEDEQLALILQHGRVAECNDAGARMWGADAAQGVVGRRLSEYPGLAQSCAWELLRNFIRSGYRLGEVASGERDVRGNPAWFCTSVFGQVIGGQLVSIWGFRREVTHRERQAAAQWQATLDASKDVVLVLDLQYRILRANAAAAAFFGLPREQMAGKRSYKLIHGTDAPMPACPVAEAMRTKRRAEAETYDPQRAAWLEIAADPVFDATGTLAGAIQTVKDITDRKTAEEMITSQLRFERLISSISARIGKVAPWEVNQEIQRGLGGVLAFFDVDRCRLFGVTPDQQSLEVIETCAAERVAPVSGGRADFAQAFPWMFRQVVHAGHCLCLPRLDGLPEAAGRDRESCRQQDIQSLLLIPLSVSGVVRFVMSIVTVHRQHAWLEDYIPRLRLLGEVFVNALARKQAEEKIRQSEDFNRTVLASLQDQVAIVDREGSILAVNEAWEGFGRENNAPVGGLGVGWNYRDVCRRAAAAGDTGAGAALAGLESVLSGARPEFLLDYRCETPTGQQWFEMVVQPLRRIEGGAVISHTNVTNQRKAELEAQRLRQEIAHVSRVTVMGELTAALAHEINQPLTAILSNSQAAQRLLAATPPDLAEIRDILADIVADNQRAGEIIRRLRIFLTKGVFQPQPLSLNTLIQEVVHLIRSDAVIREVTIALELAPDLPPVLGDRIQLQQVLLNLIINAMDALKSNAVPERKMVVRSSQPEPGKVQVSVQDSGVGLPAGQGERIFEPFFTTKPEGMGMGLSICRAIVQAHRGQIVARNNLDRGSTFQFILPLAGAEQASEQS